jgi:DNA replication protein DnaC
MTSDDMQETIGRITRNFKNRTLEQIADAEKRDKECRRRAHEYKLSVLRADWNAPERHVRCKPNSDGQWGQTLEKLTAKMGTGCLVGLIGTRGGGKTQMAVELMKQVTERENSARFITAVEFFMRIKDSYRSDASTTEDKIVRQFTKPHLLVIDEVGKRGGTDWENNLLFELINRRYNKMLDTLLIDNRSQPEFTETIGPSLASRMNEGGGIIQCNWKCFRE